MAAVRLAAPVAVAARRGAATMVEVAAVDATESTVAVRDTAARATANRVAALQAVEAEMERWMAAVRLEAAARVEAGTVVVPQVAAKVKEMRVAAETESAVAVREKAVWEEATVPLAELTEGLRVEVDQREAVKSGAGGPAALVRGWMAAAGLVVAARVEASTVAAP